LPLCIDKSGVRKKINHAFCILGFFFLKPASKVLPFRIDKSELKKRREQLTTCPKRYAQHYTVDSNTATTSPTATLPWPYYSIDDKKEEKMAVY
jgi:hypothetical protein